MHELSRFGNFFTASELLSGKPSRAIHANSIEKYESPDDGELLTSQRREEILDLLCEEYDYRGVTYEVIIAASYQSKCLVRAVEKNRQSTFSCRLAALVSDTTKSATK